MATRESLEVLFMGPRELRPLLGVPRLWQVESLFWLHYLIRFAPFDIWLQGRDLERPFGDFRYGETPWFTGVDILRRADLKAEETFLDLGSGRGKMVFLAHLLTGAHSIGAELLSGYIYVARRMVDWLKLEEVVFREEDFLETEVSEADVVYLAGSVFAEETRQAIQERIWELKPGCRFVSVTWEWDHRRLELTGSQEYLFNWGRERVFFYSVSEDDSVTTGIEDGCQEP